jgi:hypothetical protein
MKTTIRKETSRWEIEEFPAVKTRQTLANLLGASIRTISYWTAKGLLAPCRPTLRVTRFLRKDVIALLERGTVNRSSPVLKRK